MDLKPRETVLLAEDYEGTVAWYVDVLGFQVTKRFTEGYRYTNLETGSGLRPGVAPASEAAVTPHDRHSNTVILQFSAQDVPALFDHLRAAGANIMSGPSSDKAGGFWFGRFSDPEGNPIWVVDENCP